jgi:hypothetical protein
MEQEIHPARVVELRRRQHRRQPQELARVGGSTPSRSCPGRRRSVAGPGCTSTAP